MWLLFLYRERGEAVLILDFEHQIVSGGRKSVLCKEVILGSTVYFLSPFSLFSLSSFSPFPYSLSDRPWP